MFRETIVAIAATALVGLGAMVLSSTAASAYEGDYGRYCHYHRYDPHCWRYWHRDYDEDHYYEHHHHHHDYDHHYDHHDHDHDHDHEHHDHDHDHDHH